MDEGRLTDSQGKKVDFRNTLIIMTSNLGAEALAALPEGASSEQARPEVMKAVAAAYPPEFVNRLDEIVLFNRLSRDRVAKITEMELQQVRNRLAQRGMRLRVSEEALFRLADAGYNPAYGARPVRRAVRQYLLDPLAQLLIGDEHAQDGATVLVDVPPADIAKAATPSTGVVSGFFGGSATPAAPASEHSQSLRIRLLAPEEELSPTDARQKWNDGAEVDAAQRSMPFY
jgi:ATP-dependent Clp protease ATP-binding subunit ClpB